MDKSPRFSSEVAKKYLQEQSLRSSQGRSLGEDYYEFTPYAHDERVGEFNSQHRLVGGIIERFVQSILIMSMAPLNPSLKFFIHCRSSFMKVNIDIFNMFHLLQFLNILN